MPTVAEMIQDLRKREHREKTKWLFTLAAKKLVGIENWKKYHGTEEWSKFVTASCEAFLFLVLENNEEAWKVNARNKTKAPSDKEAIPKLKYTQGSKNGGKNGGYNEEGLKRYAELMKLVRENRAEHNVGSDTVEKYVLESWKNGDGADSGGKRSSYKSAPKEVAIDFEAWEV